jgi:hypothetical protein
VRPGVINQSNITVSYLILDRYKRGQIHPDHTIFHHTLVASGHDHRSFRQVIDPGSLLLSTAERMRFVNAMRLLGLKPCFNLTEIVPLISPTPKDPALIEIGPSEDKLCDDSVIISKKMRKLEEYLQRRSDGTCI